ncbi:MAG: hypothetical protein HGA65_08150 [Oscillochloris sp.]|nr:hypothetical protein [Oscillochloris sp.]
MDGRIRARTLSQLALYLPEVEQTAAYQAALEATCAIANEGDRAKTLGQLAPHLPVELLPSALEVTRAIADGRGRARALGQLAPHLPEVEQPTVYQAALEAACAITLEPSKGATGTSWSACRPSRWPGSRPTAS